MFEFEVNALANQGYKIISSSNVTENEFSHGYWWAIMEHPAMGVSH